MASFRSMTVLPVIVRELRASSRQPFTYYLRVLGVAALLLVELPFGIGSDQTFGRELFLLLHRTLFVAIWVLGPMLTADCLSRERREGTLGLLFLTPLTGRDIVMAKGLAQALRAWTLGLAVLPVLTVPFLLGGISWTDAALAVILNANAMCWALAAGLLASAWSKAWLRSLLLAAILDLAFLWLLLGATGWFLLQPLSASGQLRTVLPWPIQTTWPVASAFGLRLFLNEQEFWSEFSRAPFLGLLSRIVGQMTLSSLLMLVLAVLVAGYKTRRSWQNEPPSAWSHWWRQRLCTPVLWLALYRRWMRHRLERNPIGWLEQRTWSGRLVTWGWMAVLVSIYIVMLADAGNFLGGARELHVTLAWLLAGSMALSAAGSFRRERESGLLELLLVSPVGEQRIISGRLRGLWGQFLPTICLLLAVWCYFSAILPRGSRVGEMLFFVATFLSVPIFGLYFSLRCRNFLVAFLFTLAVSLVLPMVLVAMIRLFCLAYGFRDAPGVEMMRPSPVAVPGQLLLALVCWHRLYRRLVKRAFPLERT